MPPKKRRSLRARMITLVLTPSVVLLLVCSLFTFLLVDDIRDLRAEADLTRQVGTAVSLVIDTLQDERLATADSARDTERSDQALGTARDTTDTALVELREALAGFDADVLPDQALDLQRALDRLPAHRSAVDGLPPHQRDHLHSGGPYNDIVEQGLRFWDARVEHADPAQIPRLRSLTSLMRARELLSRQSTVFAHAVATDGFTPQAHNEFVAAAGAQRHTWDRIGAELSPEDARTYRLLESYDSLERVHDLQDEVIAAPAHTRPPVNATAWRGAAEASDQRMRAVEQDQIDRIGEFNDARSSELTGGVLLIGLPVLIVALASAAFAITGAVRMGRRLHLLRRTTLEHARVQLPRLTARLRAGHDVEPEPDAAPRTRHDEITDVADAFDDARRAAVTAALQEARLRAGVRAMFGTLARRTQSLVHRQLAVLDRLERDESDPDTLAALFRVDHFSARLRRNSENLMLLSGGSPVRRPRAPMRLYEVVRAAAGEIEDYTRVQPRDLPPVTLRGDVAADTARLSAELLENATAFSPPSTEVEVRASVDADGCRIDVIDRGLGMGEAALEEANALLADPPRFDVAGLVEDSPLGLFVVATLAARHGLRVELAAGPGGHGVRATVHVPADALTEPETLPVVTPEPAIVPAAVAPEPAPAPSAAPEPESDHYKGLPRRRRRTVAPAPVPTTDDDADRSPERLRSMMSAFQAGTLRARAGHPDLDGDHEEG
ncbi:sensor histidine kinase [Nocardiopsis lambiniae]|uniref:histidine kinase n=1 Tax=Nocardiopsis lambiniae TaxID=3075539 RepID=A0ABU2MC25_9ACTN|nr:nitrate- and nitrite sensing domain-containing protein [Nocardiopsis sp. DSM 44743]MDT0330240.1 nitrate- and nitrite sensing domain-containing protein [Nocardiopsis sp. DSM 44743]